MVSGAGGNSAASAAVVLANAIKACGVVVRMEEPEFMKILSQQEGAIVVHATGGFFTKNDQYLTSYRGLAFFTKSKYPLSIPAHCQLIEAKKISVPDF